jgi:hypothetical protein
MRSIKPSLVQVTADRGAIDNEAGHEIGDRGSIRRRQLELLDLSLGQSALDLQWLLH